jgi:GxxExxY protein
MNPEAERLNALSDQIIGAAIDVHRTLGPGLLESAYEACLRLELLNRKLRIECEKPLPLVYGKTRVGCSYRMDFVVERSIVVEVKAVSRLLPVHEAQLISYLKISRLRLGLLFNFNVMNLSAEGMRRRVNGFPE